MKPAILRTITSTILLPPHPPRKKSLGEGLEVRKSLGNSLEVLVLGLKFVFVLVS